MNLAYLHIGEPRHGVRRHGEVLAAQARRHEGISVLEEELRLGPGDPTAAIAAVAKRLGDADLVHIQCNKRLWGHDASSLWSRRRHLRNIDTFFDHCRAPVAVTAHDVYLSPEQSAPLAYGDKAPATDRHRLRPWLGLWLDGDRTLARQLLRRAALTIVSTPEERRRMLAEAHAASGSLVSIELPVEDRASDTTRSQARRSLGFEPSRSVVTVLGFLVKRKGHLLALDAMRLLPESVHLVFAGGSLGNDDRFEREVRERIEAMGLGDRVTITGYLDEADLDRYLKATDVALCPFAAVSASGSLSRWLAYDCPVVVSPLPQLQHYEQLDPGAILSFSPYSPEALAERLNEVLERPLQADERGSSGLALELSAANIFRRHLEQFSLVLEADPESQAAG